MNPIFRKIAHLASEKLGSPWAFSLALSLIVLWAVSGPFLHFSTTWQLIINTATTVLTFLMVFLIQNTQNRDAKAVHLKLDELIRAVKPARNMLIDIEDMEEEELALLQQEFKKFRDEKISAIKKHRS